MRVRPGRSSNTFSGKGISSCEIWSKSTFSDIYSRTFILCYLLWDFVCVWIYVLKYVYLAFQSMCKCVDFHIVWKFPLYINEVEGISDLWNALKILQVTTWNSTFKFLIKVTTYKLWQRYLVFDFLCIAEEYVRHIRTTPWIKQHHNLFINMWFNFNLVR